MNIKIDVKNAGLDFDTINSYKDEINVAHKMLHDKTGLGNDFVGWVDHPINYDKEEFARIQKAAAKIRGNSDVLLVVGIGGSYLGSRAVIEALTHHFYNVANKAQRNGPQVFFVGNNISGRYLQDLIQIVKEQEISVNVISKSGTTTEPALAFRVVKELMEDKYGKEGARDRIFATTDKVRGALKGLSDKEGYETFAINDDIGGRFSVLTAVGLLPIAVAGLDISQLMQGALDGYDEYKNENLAENPCYQYVAARNHLYRDGKMIEILVNYEPSLHYVSEWWKQLYGESEGKDQKGIFPAAVDFSSDLHSMGQYIQDGLRVLFETVLVVEDTGVEVKVKSDENNLDNLNYLTGSTLEFVNEQAYKGTLLAHVDGGTPNLVISIPKMDEYYLGKLLYFFMKACGVSGYVLGVNPFNQPGVEDYKKNMFALLNKPGFEDLRMDLLKRL